jgi:hypothetical protein
MLLVLEAPMFAVRYHDIAYLAKAWVKQLPHSPVSVGAFWKDVVLESQ